MPRRSRIDAPGAIHHIISRGIERKEVFKDNEDRTHFIQRLRLIIQDTHTRCYSWALIPNHFHLLLKTGTVPISTIMRRLMTGYAMYFNRRHKRHGHLFQNRYKSILCQEDIYLKELVRYIHLNPLRARLIGDLNDLDVYPYSGHAALMGHVPNDWQDVDFILRFFNNDVGDSISSYSLYIQNGIKKGKQPELTIGGLGRSHGSWGKIKPMNEDARKGDERILGDADFVDKVLEEAQEKLDRKYRLKSKGFDFERVVARVSEIFEIDLKALMEPGKQRQKVQARSLICFWSHNEIGVSQSELARIFQISPASVSVAVQRGRKFAEDNGLSIES